MLVAYTGCLIDSMFINFIHCLPSLTYFLISLLFFGNQFPKILLLLSRFSRVWLCVTPQTTAHQAPPSMGFSRQEHWSGLPFPSPMHENEKWKWSHSVVSNSLRLHGLQPSRLLCPWEFPGRSTGVGCHCLIRPKILLVPKSFCQDLFLGQSQIKTFSSIHPLIHKHLLSIYIVLGFPWWCRG